MRDGDRLARAMASAHAARSLTSIKTREAGAQPARDRRTGEESGELRTEARSKEYAGNPF